MKPGLEVGREVSKCILLGIPSSNCSRGKLEPLPGHCDDVTSPGLIPVVKPQAPLGCSCPVLLPCTPQTGVCVCVAREGGGGCKSGGDRDRGQAFTVRKSSLNRSNLIGCSSVSTRFRLALESTRCHVWLACVRKPGVMFYS